MDVLKISEAVYVNKILSSGLSYQDAEALSLEHCSAEQTATLSSSFAVREAIKFPFFNADGTPIISNGGGQFYRIRYLYTPEEEKEALGKGDKLIKYMQAKGTANHLYIPQVTEGFTWNEIMRNAEKPLFFTEGELKAAKGCKEGYPTISICGVWNFNDKKKGKFLIDEFNQFVLKGRTVYICYDSDVMEKDGVLLALSRLCEELDRQGAIPHVIFLPRFVDGEKVGLDDFFVHYENNNQDGKIAFNDLIEAAVYYGIAKELFEINRSYCYVQNPGAIVFKPTGALLKKTNFFDSLANVKIFKKTINKFKEIKYVTKNAAKEWMEWAARETASCLCYEPGKEKIITESVNDFIVKKYNTWNGWGCEPEAGDVSDFLLFFDCICKNLTLEQKEWFLGWLAWPIQNPGCKLFTAVILHSAQQGNGKTLLGEVIGRIYGDNYYLLNKERLANANFNEWSVDKSFVLADEITGARNRDSIDTLKLMITQSKLSINRKNFNLYTVRDTINYIFTTNHGDAFHLEDNDRRFFVVNVPKIMSFNQLNSIAASYCNPGKKAKNLFYFLLNYKIAKDFSPYHPAPTTKAKEEMRELGRSELENFVRLLKNEPEVISNTVGEIITAEYALELFRKAEFVTDNSKKSVTLPGISREFSAAGIEKIQEGKRFRINGKRLRFFILRNNEKWQSASEEDVKNYLTISMLNNANPGYIYS